MGEFKITRYRFEDIGGGIKVCVSEAHTFGTDSFLLSYFAAPKKHELACDLCTGCGIVPLLWMRGDGNAPNSPSVSHAYGVDIQQEAIRQMEESLKLSDIDRFTPVHSDLRSLKGVLPMGSFHLVTCNPPYKAEGTGIISTCDADKISRHETMCTLNDMVKAASGLLRYGGRLCICQLPERLVDVFEAMRANKIEPKRIRFAQGHPDKPPWLVLVEGKLGAKPFLKVEKPLLLREENGETTPEMKKVYGLYGHISTKGGSADVR